MFISFEVYWNDLVEAPYFIVWNIGNYLKLEKYISDEYECTSI